MDNTNSNIEFSIVIPCYNEAGNIMSICERLNIYCSKVQFELILVDNGSTDNTSEMIEHAKTLYNFVKKISVLKNIGYGNGIISGLTRAKADILAYTHADLQTPPEDVIKGYKLLETDKLEISNLFIKGVRVNRHNTDFFTKALNKVVQILLGFNVEDINGQPKIFHRKLIKNFRDVPLDSSFDAFVLYNAMINGLELITFPVIFEDRFYGESHMGSSIVGKTKSSIYQLKSIFSLSWKNRRREQNIFWQLIRFTITGICTSSLNYVSFYMFLMFFNIHYIYASMVGAISGMFIGFIMHRNFTFIADNNILYQFIKFNILSLSLVFMYPISIFIAVNSYAIKPELAQILVIPIIAIINFIFEKVWVFRLKPIAHSILKSWK